MTREEAINMLHGIRADNLNLDDAYTKDKYEALEMAIKALEQESKTRHWINIDKTHSKCDRCESVFEIASANGEANYCPNCGCRMVEPQESEGV